MVNVGDKVTVVARGGKATIRATVSALFANGWRWTTDWQAEGYVVSTGEGTMWVRGWVDEPEQNALLAACALGRNS